MKKVRESNFELLRLIATILIIVYHNNDGYISIVDNIKGWSFGGPSMALTRVFITSVSHMAVDCFVLISGYYSIKLKARNIINYGLMLTFFYLVAYIINCTYNNIGVLDNPKFLVKSILPFSRPNWFIQAYLFLMILSPMINKFVECTTKSELTKFLLIYLACAMYFGCIYPSEYFYFNDGRSVTTLVLVYCVGRYIRIYGLDTVKNVRSFHVFIGLCLITAIIMCIELFLPNRHSLVANCSILKIAGASCFMLLFSRISIKSKVINWFGASCLGAFLLHICEPFVGWQAKIDAILLNTYSPFLYVAGILILSATMFLCGVLLDKFRLLLQSPILRFLRFT